MRRDGRPYPTVEGIRAANRKAIELAYFGGLTYREAAEQLGEPEGTVKSRCYRARERLAVLLRVQDPDEAAAGQTPAQPGNREPASGVQGSQAAGRPSPSKEER